MGQVLSNRFLNHSEKSYRGVRNSLLLSTVISFATVAVAPAQDADNQEVDEIVVTGTSSRLPDDLSSVPGTVDVLSTELLEEQTRFGTDIGEILARNVPGLAVSSPGALSNFSQTLRGRAPAVFIDGVPTTVSLRNGARDLRSISTAALEQIEVISGSTSIFGLGGAGGVINYVTKNPSSEGFSFQTDFSTGLSLTNPDDSFTYNIQQAVDGRIGDLSFVFSGFYEDIGSLFDAEGDLIPDRPQGDGGVSNSESFNLFGKVGYDLTPDQRVFASINIFEFAQNAENLPTEGVFGSVPNTAIIVDDPDAEIPGIDTANENLVATIGYVNDNFFGSKLTLNGFYSDATAVFPFAFAPVFDLNDGGQSTITAERLGVRLDINTPFEVGGQEGFVIWGADYVEDEAVQPLIDGRLFTPPLEQTSFAPFGQVSYQVTDKLNVVGGARYEIAEVSADTFTTIFVFPGILEGGATVDGGSIDYEELLLNFGAVYSPFEGKYDGVDFYAGYSQGFTINDFGNAVRLLTPADGVTDIDEFDFQAQVIDSYEAGVRADFGKIKTSLAFFFNESEFGASVNGETLELDRAPEEVWGLEGSIEATPADDWRLGLSGVWVDGEATDIVTGNVTELGTDRIPPGKLFAFAEYDVNADWSTRVQITNSLRSSRFNDAPGFGTRDIESYTLVDASISGQVGPGVMTIAINNILNEYYFTTDAYRFGAPIDFSSGPGANARFTYSVKY